MKKRVLSVLLAGVMAFSLAACGGGGDDSSTEGGEAAASGDENTLTVFAWDPAFNIPAIQAAADDYKENVDPDFNLEIIEQASQEISRQRSQLLRLLEITAIFRILFFSRITTSRDISPITRMHGYPLGTLISIGDDFAAEKLDYSTVDGEHYGVP